MQVRFSTCNNGYILDQNPSDFLSKIDPNMHVCIYNTKSKLDF